MELAERLSQLRLEGSYTQQQVAEALDIHYQNYQRWEKGRSNPKKDSLEKLAHFFKVPVSYLLGETEVRSFSELERMLENLPETHQQIAIGYVKTICEQYEEEKSSANLYAYDVLNLLLIVGREISEKAKLGHSTVYWNKKIDYDVAMWIKGESMMPIYSNGDVALIKKQSHADYEGQVCAVNYDGNTYIKKVYKRKNGLQMVSINKKYHDFFLSWIEKPRIVGKVIQTFTPIEKDL